jgi:hypothetical protein
MDIWSAISPLYERAQQGNPVYGWVVYGYGAREPLHGSELDFSIATGQLTASAEGLTGELDRPVQGEDSQLFGELGFQVSHPRDGPSTTTITGVPDRPASGGVRTFEDGILLQLGPLSPAEPMVNYLYIFEHGVGYVSVNILSHPVG